MPLIQSNKALENKLRRQLAKQGCALRKSRVKNTHFNNLGGYMIIDLYANCVVWGPRFELDLEDVARFANS